MKRKNIIVQGNIFSYLDNELKNKTILLFLHGWRCDAQIFQSIYKNFSKDYRVISIDFPGFGGSQLTKSGLNISEYSNILSLFLYKINVHEAHFITHSFGGRVAIDFASKNQDIMKSLILINSGGIKNTSLKIIIFKLLAKLGKFLGLYFLRNIFYKYIVKEDDALHSLKDSVALKKTYQNVVGEDLQDRAKNIICPTLILWGEKDESTPLWHGKRWHNIIRNSQFFPYPGDHFFFLKDPKWCIEKIEKFLKGIK